MKPSESPPVGGDPRDRRCVLIVEDDASIRSFLSYRLHEMGYDVLAVASGEEAIAEASRTDWRADLVVTDGIMAGIDGFAVARHYARLDPPVCAILITGFIDYFASRGDIPGNIGAMLAKPVMVDDLVNTMRRLLAAAANAAAPAMRRPRQDP